MNALYFESAREEILDLLSGIHRRIGLDAREASRWEISEEGAIRIYWDDYNTHLPRSSWWVGEHIRPHVQPYIDEANGMPFKRALEFIVEGINPLLISANCIDDSLLEALITS